MNKEIIINGKRIFCRFIGQGKPVVLIHGFGEDGEIWAPRPAVAIGLPQAMPTPPKEGLYTPIFEDALLTERFQFIIPDLPGSGKSELIDDMSIEGMADLIKNILDSESSKVPPQRGFRGASIIGHSMGGYIALAFAEKYPERLNALGLFHSTAYADSEEKKAIRQKGIDFIEQHGAFEFLKTSTPNLFSAKTRDERPKLIDEQITGLRNFSDTALVLYYRAMMQRPDRTAVLLNTPVPVLFIIGEHDNTIPFKDSLRQCHLPGKTYIHILRHSGHMGMLEETEKTTHILKNFLLDL